MLLNDVYQKTHDTWVPKLKNNLSSNLIYHSVEHTLGVLKACQEIGKAEGIGTSDMHLLKIAAVFHDTGFLNSPIEHEQQSCTLATEYLNSLGVSDEQINSVCKMILATKIPQSPNSLLGKILCDADLAYLGTADYDVISKKLRKEIEINKGEPLDEASWLHIQIVFLEKHNFFTNYANKHFTEKKLFHLNQLKEALNQLN